MDSRLSKALHCTAQPRSSELRALRQRVDVVENARDERVPGLVEPRSLHLGARDGLRLLPPDAFKLFALLRCRSTLRSFLQSRVVVLQSVFAQRCRLRRLCACLAVTVVHRICPRRLEGLAEALLSRAIDKVGQAIDEGACTLANDSLSILMVRA